MTNSEIIGSASSTGADLVTDTLIRLGCRHVFNITGLGMHSLAASLYRRRAEIGYLSHVNETNLALMAQGYARQTRSPAFCFVYNASGTALALMSLTTAWADHAPLVLVTSSNSRTTTGRDQYAGIPRSAIEMGTQYTKWSYEVSIPERLPETLARAAAIAAEPPMGPVHISIPADLYDAPVTGAIPRANFGQTRYFADGCADEAGLAEIAKLLTAAELPVLLAGSEVGQLKAVEPLIELAELLGAPVLMEDLPSYLSFPTSHAQYVGGLRANEKLLADASAALAIGVEFTETGAGEEKPYLPPSVPLAALSVDPFHPTKQLWPAIAISGHPRSSVRRLTELVSQAGVAADVHGRRLAVCAELRGQRERKVEAVRALDGDTSPVPAGKLIDEIRRACGQDWTIVQVGSTAGYEFDVMYEMDHPDAFHGLSGKGSAQGWGVPVALGVQLAAPGRKVITFVGDGNLMFSATSLWGAAKNKLPMVFVVANNGGWASIPSFMVTYADVSPDVRGSDEMGWTFGGAPIDYVGFARSLGLQAVQASTANELAGALARATDSQEPWLIEVKTAGFAGK